MIRKLFPGFTWKRMLLIILGAAIVSFGLYNIHQQCGVTEGGVLGTVLLIHHWFGLPASVITPVLDISCYLLALKVLGGDFIRWSILSTAWVSGFFKLWESFPPMLWRRRCWGPCLSALGWASSSGREAPQEETTPWLCLFPP